MNQRGNEPMVMLHGRISMELMEEIDQLAAQLGISKSEYIRLALEHVTKNKLQLVKKIYFFDPQKNEE